MVGRTALLLAAYLLCTHHYERARALLERALQHASSAGADSALRRSMISLLGHTMLRQHAADVDAGLAEPGELNAALELFQGVLLDQPDDLEARCTGIPLGPPAACTERKTVQQRAPR